MFDHIVDSKPPEAHNLLLSGPRTADTPALQTCIKPTDSSTSRFLSEPWSVLNNSDLGVVAKHSGAQPSVQGRVMDVAMVSEAAAESPLPAQDVQAQRGEKNKCQKKNVLLSAAAGGSVRRTQSLL